MITMRSVSANPHSTPMNLDTFVELFDCDDAEWYISRRAVEEGLNPSEAVAAVRTRRRHRARIEGTLINQGVQHTSSPTAIVTSSAAALPLPPGFAGEIARFVYDAAPRPVPEVAIVAALGLLAGVCARQWHIPGSGLNIYVVLVARSAIGKEAMHRGVSKLAYACRARFPSADQFFSFDDFASGSTLIKGCLASPCFVNVVGEIGHKFYAMAKDTDPAMRSLRRTMTNLYSKSGVDAIAGGIAYSNQENSAKLDGSVAYSLMGETTPARFYESLTADMMSDGFMSRFNVIEYSGDRPVKNPAPLDQPNERLIERLVAIMQQSQNLLINDRFQPVERNSDAAQLLEDFEIECDNRIRQAGKMKRKGRCGTERT